MSILKSIKIKEDIHAFYKSHCSLYFLKYGHIIDSILRREMNLIKSNHLDYRDNKNIEVIKEKVKHQDSEIDKLNLEIEKYKLKLKEMI